MEEDLLAWIDAEVRSITKKYGTPYLYEKEDLISEGWIVAKKALTEFDVEKNTSLKHFVRSCVKNKIIDIFRSESYRVCEELPEEIPVVAPDLYEYINLSLSLQSFLKEDFEKLTDIIDGMKFKERRKKQGLACFQHIQQTLRLIETTQAV